MQIGGYFPWAGFPGEPLGYLDPLCQKAQAKLLLTTTGIWLMHFPRLILGCAALGDCKYPPWLPWTGCLGGVTASTQAGR